MDILKKVGYFLTNRCRDIRIKYKSKVDRDDCSLIKVQILFIFPYILLRITHLYIYIITMGSFGAFKSLVRLIIYSYLSYRFLSYKLVMVILMLFFIYLYLEYYILRKEGHTKKNRIILMTGVIFEDADRKYINAIKMLKEIKK